MRLLRGIAAYTAMALCSCLTSNAIAIGPANAQLYTFDAVRSGWYQSNGVNYPVTENFAVGDLVGYEHRNYFGFRLSGLDLSNGRRVVAAALTLHTFAMHTFDMFEEYTLFDVATPLARLGEATSPAAGIGYFHDLGTGVIYGSRFYTHADCCMNRTVEFNAAGRAAIGTANGEFVVGGRIMTLDDHVGSDADYAYEYLFGHSHAPAVRRLDVWVGVPEPSWASQIPLLTLVGYSFRRLRMCGPRTG